MKLRKTSLVDIVMDRIKAYIAENRLQPGDKFLTEKELTEKLNVSRTVVREAIISLQSVGILTIKPGGGMYIANAQVEGIRTILSHHFETYGLKVKELLEIRKVLELGALRLIIENSIAVDFDRLYTLNKNFKAGIHAGKDMKTLDADFHRQLMKEVNNEAFFNLSTVINQYFTLTNIDLTTDEQGLLTAYGEHQTMIDALKDKELTVAHTTMTKHFEPVFRWINMEGRSESGSDQ